MNYKIEDGITQSLLASFVHCRQACLYMLTNWESPEVSDALEFGTLFHYLLERVYVAMAKGDDVPALSDMLSSWRESHINLDAERVEKLEALAVALFPPYMGFYFKEDIKRAWLESESVFDHKWNGYRLRGMRDGLFNIKKDKGLWLLETKTASVISEDTLSLSLAFDFQNLYYITATEAELAKQVAGVLYNIIRKPSLVQGKSETFPAYAARMAKDVRERPEWYFKRFPLVYPKTVKERFKEELKAKLGEFESWVNRDLPTFKNERACVGRGSCEFLRACAAGGEPQRAGYLKTRVLFRELER